MATYKDADGMWEEEVFPSGVAVRTLTTPSAAYKARLAAFPAPAKQYVVCKETILASGKPFIHDIGHPEDLTDAEITELEALGYIITAVGS